MYDWRFEGNYDPHKVERSVIEFWEANKVYQLVKDKVNKNTKLFNFVDGPPYPSGDIPHLGTAWNKSLKDAVLRYRRMKGFKVNDRPGYDCHGLPIEVKVEQKLGVGSKKEIEGRIGVDNFVAECKKFALHNLRAMTKWFKELGVFMDWENPYLTLTDEYIEAAWWLIKQAENKGLLASEHRVVYWCPRCSTTLAEYEVEYRELEDPSIYVKFPISGEDGVYLLIWTTTPWTLPANVFVMAHPDEIYVKVRVGSETLVLAENRLREVMKECDIVNYDVIEKLPGKELAKYAYEHPLRDIVPLQNKVSRYHRVILSPEYVSMHEGTGLVHAAPGHGFEDYDAAKKHGLQNLVLCPVDEEGRFTSDAGVFAGINVREANEAIINALSERKALIYSGRIAHRYPICWRCKTPVILRAARQWVIKVTRLKEEIKSEASSVNWIPSWALTRLMNMLENLQDWVVSRQRYWGTPLPIWMCGNEHMVVIGSLKELLSYTNEKPLELHKPWVDNITFKCPHCGLEMKRVPDVVDVWLDSGVSFYASIGHPHRLKK
ncbi:MAG: class I tRNA ligase family protein, partial [Desulfurococcaceae archaeon]